MFEPIIGQQIAAIRNMTKEELTEEGWEFSNPLSTTVIVLSNGTIIYPSADDEGNGPGVLYGKVPNVGGIYVHP